MAKYYAVRKGKEPGIYTTWAECQKQVSGFKGAEFKSFKTMIEAQNFIDEKEVKLGVVTHEEVNGVFAYIDGSYYDGVYGSGIIIVDRDKKLEYKLADNAEEYAKLHNVVGEIEAAKFVMNYAKENNLSEITIFYDYLGVEKWATDEWEANLDYTKDYKKFVKEISKDVKVNFVKVEAHSGVELNERADVLANEARIEFGKRI